MTERAAPPAPRFLVTGSTGFIGRRVAQRIIAVHGAAALTCLVRTPATDAERAALESQRAAGVSLIAGDLMSRPPTGDVPPRCDVVIHLAANIDTNARDEDLRVNHEGTTNLLDWLMPMLPGVRLIYASSVAVHDRDREPRQPITEDSPFVSRTAYGVTKLAGETIVRERAPGAGYRWTIMRLPTVYGPGQKVGGLFDQMITFVKRGALSGRIDWPGRTSIIHIDDLVDAILTLALMPEAADEIYCVASGESLTVGEIAQTIGRTIQRPVRPVAIPASMLTAIRGLVWNRTVRALMPPPGRLPFWRLSLIVSDGFWFDTAKFRRIYRGRLRPLAEGLMDTIDPS